ncbi:uncharacterized protein BDR25DRAFT_383108, partial [Lindgomyces ingoldianus]
VLNRQKQELFIVVDGIDRAERQNVEFIQQVRAVIGDLPARNAKVTALITSQPDNKIKEVLSGLPNIEYDEERKEYLASLRFDNTRYSKISEEHKGSLEWLWTHNQYQEWSSSNNSRLLCIEGKPGSGKSTLAKYFKDNFLEWNPDAESAILADFFFSYREGKLQTSHHNMLRSVLYAILDQNETFFYHFQSKYRIHKKSSAAGHVEWSYSLLKDILLSLRDHEKEERIYLIVDAVDESDDEDRRDILQLLLELCSTSKCCIIKIFIASRPVSEVQHYINKFHNIIRMQDETKADIKKFTDSFLGPELGLTGDLLREATEYIVDHAQGVFLWVSLVREEMRSLPEKGYRDREIIEQLKALPTEMEHFYERIVNKMEQGSLRDVRDGTRMFQYVLFALRPLTVKELQHALAIDGDPNRASIPSDQSFEGELIQGMEKRIAHCGGGLLEIKGDGNVQVIHQTVREFFLRRGGHVAKSRFKVRERDAHASITIICTRYLLLCAANTALENKLLDVEDWTSQHFDAYTQYLNERPLMNYTLSFLKHHISGC